MTMAPIRVVAMASLVLTVDNRGTNGVTENPDITRRANTRMKGCLLPHLHCDLSEAFPTHPSASIPSMGLRTRAMLVYCSSVYCSSRPVAMSHKPDPNQRERVSCHALETFVFAAKNGRTNQIVMSSMLMT